MANLVEGLGAAFAMASDATLKFTAISLTVPGGSVAMLDLTTLSNTAYKTKVAAALAELKPFKIEALYDIDVWADLVAAKGVNTLCTATQPANSGSHTVAIYAALSDWDFSPFKAGDIPTITLEFTPTMRHSSTGAETAPATT